MITLVSVTQNRMGVGRVTLPFKGPMRGQYVFLMAKSQCFYIYLLVLETLCHFIEMIMLVVWKVP